MTDIRLIALDLDKTLLNTQGKLSGVNRAALEKALGMGVEVVPATGRAKNTVSEEILGLGGVRRLICANGAAIYNLESGEKLYEHLIPVGGIESMWDMLTDNSFMKEVFFEGSPYTDEAFFKDLGRYGVAPDFLDYYRATRKPVPDLPGFIGERKDRIEVINLIFADEGLRMATRERLEKIPGVETTTSLGFNLEVGAKGASKGKALSRLCEMLEIEPARTLSCGDNDNDISMLVFSGIGVAMGNATDNAKAAADFVTKPNDEDGVAFALEKFVFRQP